jgi:hypothetical protein
MVLLAVCACTEEQPRRGDETRAPASTAGQPVCKRTVEGEAGDLALARCLATSELVPGKHGGEPAVVVYFDRSGSMRGFLDPKYPTRIPTDYRAVIDRLVVGLRPVRGYSFGSALRPADPTLATLGAREFYTDKDTQTEQVLHEIARDTATRETHIIITDGRRGSPTAGDAQFVKMRELASRWVERDGAFLVATSLAPFQTVTSDPSGCRRRDAADGAPQTCPLYAFGFIAPGDVARVTASLAGVFEHLFVWPAPVIPPSQLSLVPKDMDRRDIRVERRWASGEKGTPIVRVRGDSATNKVLTVAFALRDTTTPEGRAHATILAGQGVRVELRSRAFTPAAAAQAWNPVEARGALVTPVVPSRDAMGPGAAPPALDLVTRGPRAPVTMFQVDLVPTGAPSWLDAFDAVDAKDVVRTYGLGRLFEGFRTRGGKPFARIYIVAN